MVEESKTRYGFGHFRLIVSLCSIPLSLRFASLHFTSFHFIAGVGKRMDRSPRASMGAVLREVL